MSSDRSAVPAGAVGQLLTLADPALSAEEREARLQPLTHRPFRLTLEVQRVQWTMDSAAPEEVVGGQTVLGSLPGGPNIAVLFPVQQDAAVRNLPLGAQLELTVTLLRWDGLYERLVAVVAGGSS